MSDFQIEEFGSPMHEIKELQKTVKNIIYNSVVTYSTITFTATVDNTHLISHNLSYVPAHDTLQVFYNGILLEKDINYSEPSNTSIDLVDWSINTDEQIVFKLFKNVKV